MGRKRRYYFMLSIEEGSLGDVIRRERMNNNWTQEELADKIDVDQSRISSWETGKHLPSFDKLLRLDDAFRLEPGTLLGRSPWSGARGAALAAPPICGSIIIRPSETAMMQLVELADELDEQEFAGVLDFIKSILHCRANVWDSTSESM